MRVGLDGATRAHLDPQRLEPKASGIRFAAGGDQNHVGGDCGFGVVFAQFVGGGGADHTLDCGTEDELNALFHKDFLEGFLHLGVHAGGDRVEVFDHGHLGAQAGVDGTQLQSDDTCADHGQGFGDLCQGQGSGGGDDFNLVHRDAGQA